MAGIEPETARPRPRAGGITWRLVVLVIAFLGVAVVLGQSLRIYFAQAAEIAEVRERIAVTQEKIAEQRDQLNRWNDPAYVRSQARVRLGWVVPGETGYRVIGADGAPIDGSETVGKESSDVAGPWYDRMWTSVQVADEPAPEAEEKQPDDRVITLEESPSPSPSPTPEASPTNP